MSAGRDRKGLDPEIDLLGRYQGMIETQVASINEIDEKASTTAKLIGILLGLVLTAASFAVTSDLIEFTDTTLPFFVLLGVALATLFISLSYTIITYLSSTLIHGPTGKLGDFLADYRVDEQQYIDIMLRTYSQAIAENKGVIFENADRFKRALASLLAALLFLLGAGVLLVAAALDRPIWADWLVLVLFVSTGCIAAYQIGVKDYLTVRAEHLAENNVGGGKAQTGYDRGGGSDYEPGREASSGTGVHSEGREQGEKEQQQ